MFRWRKETSPNLKSWLQHVKIALDERSGPTGKISSIEIANKDVNELSQINVIKQIENLTTYPIMQVRLKQGRLSLHAWWFDLQTANVLYYSKKLKKFLIIDEKEANAIIENMT